jgi:hypothetical protein
VTSTARQVGSITLVFGLIAALAVGSGPINGDAAVYAHQASEGDFSQRWVHLGWVGLLYLVSLTGLDPGLAADMLTVGAAMACVAIAGHLASREERGSPAMASVLVGGAILPVASWGEVDLPWVALVGLTVALEAPFVTGLAMAAAVTLSPAALLALPWVVGRKAPDWAAVLGAMVAVAVLTVVSGGEWWSGDRGVLTGAALDPIGWLRRWSAVLTMTLVLALPAGKSSWTLLLLAPLVLAPADTAVWALGVLAIGSLTTFHVHWRAARWSAVVAFALVGVAGWSGQWSRVDQDRLFVEDVVGRFSDRLPVEAQWTMGVRLSLASTGDPYGLMWRIPNGWVRDQRERWCQNRKPTESLVVTHVQDGWRWRVKTGDPEGDLPECP